MDAYDLPATARRVAAVAQLAQLGPDDTGEVLDLACPPATPAAWATRLRLGLRALGAAFLVAAVVYGVAWNWSGLGYLTRLAMAEAAFAVAAITAIVLDPTTRAGRPAAVAAGALIGPILAQVGISYQTGADMWTLFAAWAALSAPLVASARSGPAWAAWTVLVQLTAGLWLGQNGYPDNLIPPIVAAIPLGAAAVLTLAGRLPDGQPSTSVTALVGDSLLITTPFVCFDLLSRRAEAHLATSVLLSLGVGAAAARLVLGRDAGGGALVGLVLIALIGSTIRTSDDFAGWILIAVATTAIAAGTGAAIRHFTASSEDR